MKTNGRSKLLVLVAMVGLGMLALSLVIVITTKEPLTCPSVPLVDPYESPVTHPARTTVPPPDPSLAWSSPRLPRHVVPLHYHVRLHPNLKTGTFRGEVSLHFSTSEHIQNLWLHAWKLNITSARVVTDNGKEVGVGEHFDFPHNEFHVFPFKEHLMSGNATLNVTFEGSLLNGMAGFYRSEYRDSVTNTTRYLATSKFQPTYARRAFPCMDEPGFKTPFTVQLVHEPHMTALSNMDVKGITPWKDNLVVTSFHESVPMVTYLTCFIVCDFNFSGGHTKDGKPFKVWSRPDQVNLTKFALDVGVKVQDRYAEYFDIPYPLPKQDMIAIPDFASGAMEHWGLITYRETALLYDPAVSSVNQQEYTAQVIAHEVTHQWFGNLMTMEWWDDLWLNEGFATFFSYTGMQWVLPEWNTEAYIVTRDYHVALHLDDKLSSHPIVQPVKNPDQITEIFDTISYKKGSSILRMLSSFVGESQFRKGIQVFLKKHEFSHARTQDLWTALSEEVKELNVSNIMNTWTCQMGYPVVHIHRHAHDTMSHMTANQSRFLSNPEAKYDPKQSKFGYMWEIPLTYRTSRSNQSHTVWMHSNTSSLKFEIENVTAGEWLKFNVDQTGFYRVNYEAAGWKQLSDALAANHEAFSVADRANLLDDSFSLAFAGHVTYDIPLNLSLYLTKERSVEPWFAASSSFAGLADLLYNTDLYRDLREHVLRLAIPFYNEHGWNDTGSHNTKKLRQKVLRLTCYLDHPDCLSVAATKLHDWLENGTKIPSDQLSVVFSAGVKVLGQDAWEKLWERYLKEDSAQMKGNLVIGLTSTRISWLLSRLLAEARNETKVRRQDFFRLVSLVSLNPVGKYLAWQYIREEWDNMVKRFTLNDRYLGKLVSNVASEFTTETQLLEVKDFFTHNREGGAGARGRQTALESIHTNIDWWKRNQDSLRTWFQQHHA